MKNLRSLIGIVLAQVLFSFAALRADTNSIAPGEIKSGSITNAGQNDFYTFNANAGDTIYLTLLRTNGATPWFYLLKDGNELPRGTRAGPLVVSSQTLPETGTYMIEVIEDSHTLTLDYLLALTIIQANNLREPGDGPEALTPGTLTGGHISLADLDTFTFTGKANDSVYIQVLLTNGPAAYPFFYLYDPDGNIFDRSSYYSYKAIWSGQLPKDGKYTFGVIHYISQGEFDYTVCMVKFPGTNQPDPGEGPELIQPGQTRSGAISPGDLDAYAFSAIAGDSLQLALSQTSGLGGSYMYLYGPDGDYIGGDRNRIRVPCATKTGRYSILCLDAVGDGAFGYDLKLTLSPEPPTSVDPLHPYLTIFRCMTDTVLRWPTNAANFDLEYTTGLPGGQWSSIPPPYSFIADHYYVTNQSSDPFRFYRLSNPMAK